MEPYPGGEGGAMCTCRVTGNRNSCAHCLFRDCAYARQFDVSLDEARRQRDAKGYSTGAKAK